MHTALQVLVCIGAEQYMYHKNVLPTKGNRICKYALDYEFQILVCIGAEQYIMYIAQKRSGKWQQEAQISLDTI